jgi:hypothetical protein
MNAGETGGGKIGALLYLFARVAATVSCFHAAAICPDRQASKPKTGCCGKAKTSWLAVCQ